MVKVLWLGRSEVEVTWEPASSLSSQLIKKFEDGIACELVEATSTSYGRRTSTLAVLSPKPVSCSSPYEETKAR